MTMTEAEIARRFAQIVAASLQIDPVAVVADARLPDLGMESLDLLEIRIDSEKAFSILLPERDILDHAREVFGEGVLEQDGLLTDAGRRLIQTRLQGLVDLDGAQPLAVADIRREFMRVDVWLRMIRLLMAETPKTCVSCGQTLEPSPPGRVKCPDCGQEYSLRHGDEVNREWVHRYHEHETMSSPSVSSPVRPQG